VSSKDVTTVKYTHWSMNIAPTKVQKYINAESP